MLSDPEVAAARAEDLHDCCDFDHFMLHSTELGAAALAASAAGATSTVSLDKNIVSRAVAAVKKRRAHAKAKHAQRKADKAARQAAGGKDMKAAAAPTTSDWSDYRIDVERQAAAAATTTRDRKIQRTRRNSFHIGLPVYPWPLWFEPDGDFFRSETKTKL